MPNKQMDIVFGVAGGGSISGESGKLIFEQITAIINGPGGINSSDAVKLKIRLDEGSAKNVQSQIQKMLRSARVAGTVGGTGQSTYRSVSQDALKLSEATKRARNSVGELSKAWADYSAIRDNSGAGENEKAAALARLTKQQELYRNSLNELRGISEADARRVEMDSTVKLANAVDVVIKKKARLRDEEVATNARSAEQDRAAALKAEEDAIGSLISRYTELQKQYQDSARKTGPDSNKSGELASQLRALDAEFATTASANKFLPLEDAYRRLGSACEGAAAKERVLSAAQRDTEAAASQRSAEQDRAAALKAEEAVIDALISKYRALYIAYQDSVRKTGEGSGASQETGRQLTSTARDFDDSAAELRFMSSTEAYNKLRSAMKDVADAQKILDEQFKTSAENTAASAIKSSSSVQTLLSQMEKYLTANSRIADSSYGAELRDYVSELSLGNVSKDRYKEIQAGFVGIKNAARDAGLEGKTLGQRIGTAFEKFGGWSIVTRTMMGAWRTVRDMVKTVTELDSAMTQMRIICKATDAEFEKFFDGAAKKAKEFGTTITDVIKSAETYARLGFSLGESLDLSSMTSIYGNVADVQTTDATNAITAIVKAFDINISNLERILDELVWVGNSFPVSAAELGEGLNNAASALATSGNSFEESLAILTAANTTVQDISKASTAVRTISARIRNSSTDLEALGEELESEYDTIAEYQAKLKAMTGVDILAENQKDFRSTYDILNDIAEVWEELSGTDKASVTKMLAGIRQTNVFSSLMSEWKEAQAVMDGMSASEGTLASAQAKYVDSIQGRVGQLKASFQELSNNLFSSDISKFAVSTGTAILSFVNGLRQANMLLPTTLALVTSIYSVAGPEGGSPAATYTLVVTRNEYAA